MEPPPLLERDRELGLLASAADDVAAGISRIVVVTGEPGVGKSRLCRTFLDQLPSSWSWTCDTAAKPAGTVGDDSPTVVFADDLHERDAEAVARLGTMGEGPRAVLVLATYRLGGAPLTSDSAVAVAGLIGRHDGLEILLKPISLRATACLVDHLGGAPDGVDAASIHARTGGNPLFVEEVVRAGTDVPWTVAATVLARTKPLPDAARAALDAMAIAGRPLPDTVLARVHPGAIASVPALVEAALVVVDHGEVRLRHPLVGEIVAERLDPHDRVTMHRLLADAWLACATPPAGDVARHLVAAGAGEDAGPWAALAAEEAIALGAFTRATQWFLVALGDPPTSSDGSVLEHPSLSLTRVISTRPAGTSSGRPSIASAVRVISIVENSAASPPAAVVSVLPAAVSSVVSSSPQALTTRLSAMAAARVRLVRIVFGSFQGVARGCPVQPAHVLCSIPRRAALVLGRMSRMRRRR